MLTSFRLVVRQISRFCACDRTEFPVKSCSPRAMLKPWTKQNAFTWFSMYGGVWGFWPCSLYSRQGSCMPPSICMGMSSKLSTGWLKLESRSTHFPCVQRMANAWNWFVHRKPEHVWSSDSRLSFIRWSALSGDWELCSRRTSYFYKDLRRLCISESEKPLAGSYVYFQISP